MKKLIFALLALMPLSSCELLYDIDYYDIGGDNNFQHGVDNVIVNHTLNVVTINFWDGRQRTFGMERAKVAVDSTKGELIINKVTLYF